MSTRSPAYTSLSVNAPTPLVERVDRHVVRNRPFVRRHAVHLAAIVLGLELLDQHPEKLAEALEEAERLKVGTAT